MIAKTLAVALALSAAAAPAFADCAGHKMKTDTSAQTTRRFSPGVNIPAGLIDNRYVPQGLTSWPNWNGTSEDLLLIAAYHDGDGNSEPDGASAGSSRSTIRLRSELVDRPTL